MTFEWKTPPTHDRRADRVARRLRQRPGRWARIAHRTEGFEFLPWYLPFQRDSRYELRVVQTTSRFLGPRDIYVRYIGEAER